MVFSLNHLQTRETRISLSYVSLNSLGSKHWNFGKFKFLTSVETVMWTIVSNKGLLTPKKRKILVSSYHTFHLILLHIICCYLCLLVGFQEIWEWKTTSKFFKLFQQLCIGGVFSFHLSGCTEYTEDWDTYTGEWEEYKMNMKKELWKIKYIW